MLRLRKILVPVDFSDPSKKALGYGLSLAIEFDATLLLAHIVPYSVPLAYAYPVEAREMTKTQADEIKARLRELVDGEYRGAVHSHVIVKVGNIEDELLGIVDDEAADPVVMGTHGRRRFERWLLGSVTERILTEGVSSDPDRVAPGQRSRNRRAATDPTSKTALRNGPFRHTPDRYGDGAGTDSGIFRGTDCPTRDARTPVGIRYGKRSAQH